MGKYLEALKRIEELELSCSYKDQEIRQLNANFNACKHLADKNIELHKRIDELEQKNQKLKDRFKRISNDFDNLVKENDRLEQENERIKNNIEWCDGCKEADRENHCCHRYSHFIKHCANEMKEYYENVIKENQELKDDIKALFNNNYLSYRYVEHAKGCYFTFEVLDDCEIEVNGKSNEDFYKIAEIIKVVEE